MLQECMEVFRENEKNILCNGFGIIIFQRMVCTY